MDVQKKTLKRGYSRSIVECKVLNFKVKAEKQVGYSRSIVECKEEII